MKDALLLDQVSDNLHKLCHDSFPNYCKYCPVFIANGNKRPNKLKTLYGCDYKGMPYNMMKFINNIK